MNRMLRTQPTAAMGFAAHGIGSSCAAGMTKFVLAPVQTGVAATK